MLRPYLLTEKAMKNYLKGYVEKADDAKNGVLRVAVATDSSVDRDGEIIDSNGWDFNNFLKNPVLLWAHDYREEPVGKVTGLQKDGDRVLFSAELAVGISEKATRIYELFQKGFLNAFSVGFIPKEWKDGVNEMGKAVRTFTKTELLEISVVPVPANANALVMARGYAQEKGWSWDDLGIKESEAEVIPPAEEKETEIKTEETPVLSDEQKSAIEEIVKDQIGIAMKDVADEITTLKELMAKKGEEDIKVEGTGDDGLTADEVAKRVLQVIDKGIGEALRNLKETRKS